MKVEKFCVGIDISKEFLDCIIGFYPTKEVIKFSKVKRFKNSIDGFEELIGWVENGRDSSKVLFVMEATGVYYENLAYWLSERNLSLAVILPNKVNHFSKSHNFKTKTDSVDAQILSRMGLERRLDRWKVPSPRMREIKFLTREYRDLKSKLVCAKNQLHAKTSAYKCPKSVQRRLNRQIKLLEKQVLEVEAELRITVMEDETLADQVERIESIPGVSFMTIICILGETDAFALIRNSKQLVSYCGLDIQHHQSGNTEGKQRVSKKGNSYIRSALYMPALSALQHNPDLKVFYNRLIDKKKLKKKAVTAVARKLLILIYVLWKNNSEYEYNYAS